MYTFADIDRTKKRKEKNGEKESWMFYLQTKTVYYSKI